jgi:hypothetical protein
MTVSHNQKETTNALPAQKRTRAHSIAGGFTSNGIRTTNVVSVGFHVLFDGTTLRLLPYDGYLGVVRLMTASWIARIFKRPGGRTFHDIACRCAQAAAER